MNGEEAVVILSVMKTMVGETAVLSMTDDAGLEAMCLSVCVRN